MLNKNVLRSRLNARYDDDVLIAAGNAFHALTAATRNVRSPSVIGQDYRTFSALGVYCDDALYESTFRLRVMHL